MKRIVSLALLVSFLASCTASISKNKAEAAMHSFFDALASGDYETAASYYDGTYDKLAQMNPDVSPGDFAVLWQRGCEQNGFACMKIRDIVGVTQTDSQFEFRVTFETKDGELFQFTGCCGETLPKPITEFEILVRMDADGNYKVHSLPPYVP